MPAEVKKTARRKLRTGPIQMLFPCADVLIENSGLVAGMTELSRRVIFRVVPLVEVMLVFPGVDQEKLVILLQRACLNIRLEDKRALVPVIPGINDGLHELPVVVRRSVFQKAASRSRRPATCDSDIVMLHLNSGRTEIVFSVRPLFFGIREF